MAPHVAERARAALGVPDGADSLVILALGSLWYPAFGASAAREPREGRNVPLP